MTSFSPFDQRLLAEGLASFDRPRLACLLESLGTSKVRPRRMAGLRLDDITRGLENFAHPSARGMLESMGRTREEQVEALAAMLRNSSDEDMAELAQIFGEAMARLAEERAAGGSPRAGTSHQPAVGRTERPRRPRGQTAAERRRQRLTS